ncbi:hypothetical protein HOE22_07405 [Candidatus Woesearchaeota archaeon]|jgi:hypothetical protein|nr:hypothetical protein [Candidatus Woesearchaeota archaeon]
MNDWDKILKDFARKCKGGAPDMTNSRHLALLRESLIKFGWKENATNEFIGNLREGEEIVTEGTNKKLSYSDVGKKLAKIKSIEQQGTVDKKIYGDISPVEFIKRIKTTFKGATNVKSYDAGDTVQEPTGSGKGAPKRMSSKARWFTWKWKGNNYDIGLMPKSAGGRGSNQTKDQELSWMLVLSGMQYGGNPKNKEEFLSLLVSNSSVYGKIDGVNQNTAEGLAAFLEENDSWYNAHVKQCEKFIKKINNDQPIKYVKDSSTLSVNTIAQKLYKQDFGGKTLDTDKWNPADIWLQYGSVKKSATSLNEYNNWIMDSLKNGSGWVGVSLKKGGGKVGIVNNIMRPEYKVTGLETKYGGLLSQGVTFNYKGTDLDGFGLNFRIFQGRSDELIRGEVIKKGAEAVQGKAKLTEFDTFKKGIYSAVKGVYKTNVKLDKKTKKFVFDGATGKKNFSTVKTAFGKIKNASYGTQHGDWKSAFGSEKAFLDRLNTHPKIMKKKEGQIKSALNARFQTIVLGSIVTHMSNKDLQKVMVGMLLYGKSESSWSAAHWKAQ